MTPAPSAPRVRRVPAYMMHPLGAGADREENRQRACLWQAALQAKYSDYLILAPWIGLSGAWSEDRRDEGLAVDFATIDLSEVGFVTGPLVGPKDIGRFKGVSPGMALEIQYYADTWPQKELIDVRGLFEIRLGTAVSVAKYRPRYAVGDKVLLENKHGDHEVLGVEETAGGVFRYKLASTSVFFAYEYSIGGKV